jgi:protein associated with RNAse G/E
VAWDAALYVDLAQQMTIDDERVVTMDLDVDVIRRRSGEVATVGVEEFDLHRRQLGYPSPLVTAVRREAERLADAIAREQAPFRSTPNTPTLPRTPDAW